METIIPAHQFSRGEPDARRAAPLTTGSSDCFFRSDSRLCAPGFGCGTGRRRSAGRTSARSDTAGTLGAGRPHNPC